MDVSYKILQGIALFLQEIASILQKDHETQESWKIIASDS